jgi:hypothetical protein
VPAFIPLLILIAIMGLLAIVMIGVAFASWLFSKALVAISQIKADENLLKLAFILPIFAASMLMAGMALGLAAIPFVIGATAAAIGLTILFAATGNTSGVAGLIAIGNAKEAFWNLAQGMFSLVDAPYVRFPIAATGTAAGLATLLSVFMMFGSGVDAFVKFTSNVGASFWNLKNAMYSIVDSPHDKFGHAAACIGYGLASLLWPITTFGSVVSQLDTLGSAFDKLSIGVKSLAESQYEKFHIASINIAAGIWWLFSSLRSAPIDTIIETGIALSQLADSLQKYTNLEAATHEASAAISEISKSIGTLEDKMGVFGLIGAMSSIIIQTRTEPLEKARQASQDDATSQLLKDIRDGINNAVAGISKINGKTDGESVAAIVSVLQKIYMNAMENRPSLISQTSNWYQ